MVSSAAATRRASSGVSAVLLAFAAVFFSGTAGAQTINSTDCVALLSWKPYAAIAGVASCSPLPSCSEFKGVACSGSGSVTNIYLYNNKLSGTLPKEWSTMTSLTNLDLDSNNLSGTLPKEWSTMTSLHWLLLDNNNLSGTLPKEWSTMTSLVYLWLDRNNLSGTLPQEWSTMTSLSSLLLRDNPGLRMSSWPKFPALEYMDVSNTSANAASLTRWMQSYFCTLQHPDAITMPNGEVVRCGQHRITATVIICSAVLSMLLLVTVLRCCGGRGACCMCCKPNHSSGHWMEWVSSQWGRSTGAQKWLLPQWTLFLVLLDVGSDIWVLVQVAPTGHKSLVWPFAVLLGGLFVPDLVASAVACWTWMSHRRPTLGVLPRLLLTTAWFLPFTVWLHINIILHSLVKLFAACPSRTSSMQSQESFAPTLSRVVDPMRYVAFRSTIMAVTEDPISMGVTSAFYLVNKQQLGQVLATPTYCISMLLSGVHVSMEVWEHIPAMREGLGGCLAGVCNLQPEGKGADGEEHVLPAAAGVPQSLQMTV